MTSNDDIFDKHCIDYNGVLAKSIGFKSTDSCEIFDNYKVEIINEIFLKESQYSILDFGCGIGKLSVLLAQVFNNSKVFGFDISEKALLYARKRNENLLNLSFIQNLPDHQEYDIILAANVFHHIKKQDRFSTLWKICSLLNPNGTIIIFEHNPINPLTRHIVNRCPFDIDVELINLKEFIELARRIGLNVIESRYTLIFPWSSRIFRRIERILSRLPIGTQYLLLLKKFE